MKCVQSWAWRVVLAGWMVAASGCARKAAEHRVRVPEAQYVEIAMATPRLAESLLFYQGLGFVLIKQTDRPQPSARLTDGVVVIDVMEGVFASPQLHYYKPRPGPEGQEAAVADPSGVTMVVYHFPVPAKIAGFDAVSTSKMGRFSELSIGTGDLKASMKYWEKMGFKVATSSEVPYPWAVMSDGSITVGLQKKGESAGAGLTYSAADMAGRIAALKKAGYRFSNETMNAEGKVGFATLTGPGGERIYLVEE